MVTRFVRAGYQPECGESTVQRVRRAVEGLGDLMDVDEVAGRIDDVALREAQLQKDAVRAYELVYGALGA